MCSALVCDFHGWRIVQSDEGEKTDKFIQYYYCMKCNIHFIGIKIWNIFNDERKILDFIGFFSLLTFITLATIFFLSNFINYLKRLILSFSIPAIGVISFVAIFESSGSNAITLQNSCMEYCAEKSEIRWYSLHMNV